MEKQMNGETDEWRNRRKEKQIIKVMEKWRDGEKGEMEKWRNGEIDE
jgi:hypothetical protein